MSYFKLSKDSTKFADNMNVYTESHEIGTNMKLRKVRLE